MNYHNILTDNMDNGDGIRVVLWVSGCEHHCDGCQNPETWDSSSGIEFDDSACEEIREQLKQEYISGITISGGDPFHPDNRKSVCDLIIKLKDEFPDKTVWVYTGYTLEQLLNIKDTKLLSKVLLNYIDVIIDGKFIEELRNTSLMWRGSPNQRVIDMHKSAKSIKVISYIPLEENVKKYMPNIECRTSYK